ncbi:hypothetical protein D3C79_826910 [compost metagenome]
MGIAIHVLLAHPHISKQLKNTLVQGAPVQTKGDLQWLGNNRLDFHFRVQRGVGILEHHTQAPAPRLGISGQRPTFD